MRRLNSGSRIRIVRPGALHGTAGIVLRAVSGGYEVGFTSASGTPLHAVVHPRWLRVTPAQPSDAPAVPAPERLPAAAR